MFAEASEAERICSVIDSAIDASDIKLLPKYKKARAAALSKAAAKAVKRKGNGSSSSSTNGECYEEEQEGEELGGEEEEAAKEGQKKKRKAPVASKAKPKPKEKEKEKEKKSSSRAKAGEDALIETILSKRSMRPSVLSGIMSKYGGDGGGVDPFDDPFGSDEAFAAAQAKVMLKKKK